MQRREAPRGDGPAGAGRRGGVPPFMDRAVEASVNGICVADASREDTPILYVNPAFERMTGYAAAEVVGRNCRFLQGPDRDEAAAARIRAAVRDGASCQVVLRNYRRDGGMFWNELYLSPVRDEAGRLVAFIGVQNDVTAARDLERQVADDRFRALVQHATDVITLLDAGGTVLYESPALTRILGYSPEEVVGRQVLDFLHPEDVAFARMRLARALAGEPSAGLFETRCRHRDGSWRHLEVVGTNLLHVPAIRAVVINSRDVSERKAAEARLAHQAFHDALTALPNRALLLDRLGHALAARRGDDDAVGVLLLDLDRFQVVNDSLGHDLGDQLLMAAAERLLACVRPEDTVARLGGDEFAVLLGDMPGPRAAERAAERILAALSAPFRLAGHAVSAAASIGVATSAARQTSVGLLRDADVALYRAKAKGRGRYEVFDEAMNARALERLGLEADLRRAVASGAFAVHYQPKVDLATGRPCGAEALVRWPHPARGLLAPGLFIPLAEETGLIHPLGQWVLEEACRQTRAWGGRAPAGDAPVTSVNLSARQFQEPTLVADVARALAGSGVDPRRIQLEITETVAMGQAEATAETLRRLRALGVGLAIDDFGTGYSSLAYLRRFPVDALKIDRAFVSALRGGREDASIVGAIAGLGHALGLSVVAEGVETAEEAAQVAALGCHVGQGYYFARPLPADEAWAYLARGSRHVPALG